MSIINCYKYNKKINYWWMSSFNYVYKKSVIFVCVSVCESYCSLCYEDMRFYIRSPRVKFYSTFVVIKQFIICFA